MQKPAITGKIGNYLQQSLNPHFNFRCLYDEWKKAEILGKKGEKKGKYGNTVLYPHFNFRCLCHERKKKQRMKKMSSYYVCSTLGLFRDWSGFTLGLKKGPFLKQE